MSYSKQQFVMKQDFRQQRFGGEFEVFKTEGHVADDGKINHRRDDGLIIKANPYKKRGTGVTDHTKWVVFTNAEAEVPDHGEVFIEAELSFEAIGLDAPGISKYLDEVDNVQDDPRLSTGALTLFDLASGLSFAFLLTNQRIYALYEHLPINNDTGVFSQWIPIATRPDDLNKFQTFRIAYHSGRRQVKWFINGIEVYQLSRPGLPLPKAKYYGLLRSDGFKEIEIKSLVGGFGLYTYLDFFLGYRGPLARVDPDEVYFQQFRDQKGELQEQTKFSVNKIHKKKIDGQGGILRIKEFSLGRTLFDRSIPASSSGTHSFELVSADSTQSDSTTTPQTTDNSESEGRQLPQLVIKNFKIGGNNLDSSQSNSEETDSHDTTDEQSSEIHDLLQQIGVVDN